MAATPATQDVCTAEDSDGGDPNEAQSRLLRLPAELRNRIYELVVLKDKPIEIVELNRDSCKPSKEAMMPAIAQTCRQLYYETLPMFYADNNFKSTTCWAMDFDCQEAEMMICNWLANMSVANQKALRSVTICTAIPRFVLNDGSLLYNSVEVRIDGSIRHPQNAELQCVHLAGWHWIEGASVEDECDDARIQAQHGSRYSWKMDHHLLVRVD